LGERKGTTEVRFPSDEIRLEPERDDRRTRNKGKEEAMENRKKMMKLYKLVTEVSGRVEICIPAETPEQAQATYEDDRFWDLNLEEMEEASAVVLEAKEVALRTMALNPFVYFPALRTTDKTRNCYDVVDGDGRAVVHDTGSWKGAWDSAERLSDKAANAARAVTSVGRRESALRRLTDEELVSEIARLEADKRMDYRARALAEEYAEAERYRRSVRLQRSADECEEANGR
jgi:hypothetical protein